eukprot:Gb_26390 [translate_table: standard]
MLPFVGLVSTNTQHVGLLVAPAPARSSFDGTYIYGISASSHRIGTCVITSIGEMFPAITHNPFFPRLMAFTTSFTPRFKYFASEARLTSFKVLLVSFFPARGRAMGDTATTLRLSFEPFSVSTSLPIFYSIKFH